jgi:transcriptional regulator with XRE-family HTH domain
MKANGTSIRTFREKADIGLRQLARGTGKSCGFISRLETGQRTASEETLRSIASELGVPVEAITYPEPVSTS